MDLAVVINLLGNPNVDFGVFDPGDLGHHGVVKAGLGADSDEPGDTLQHDADGSCEELLGRKSLDTLGDAVQQVSSRVGHVESFWNNYQSQSLQEHRYKRL